jgi:hypothetical protein
MAYVYILENKTAQCIKIGATLNYPDDRLIDISRMWRAVKGRHQVCLYWRMLNKGLMPKHILSGRHCFGSGQLPLERSTNLAEEQLTDLREQLPSLRGAELNFATKRIKNLSRILQNYKNNPVRYGKWVLKASFKTESAYSIESVVHKTLATHLDKNAPFGEVFLCSVEDAISAVENAIQAD